MRLKSYFATVVSSFLLLSTGCLQPQASQTEKAGVVTVVEAPGVSDRPPLSPMLNPHVYVEFDTGDIPAYAVLDPEVLDPETSAGVAIVLGDDDGGETEEGGSAPPTASKKKRKKKDGCYKGHMRFEGKCWDKRKVDVVLDQRQREAMEKVQTAKGSGQTADASHDLLEQQIAQMDKTEDDLDEIIEQLKEEQEAQDKKGDQ